MTTTPNLEHLRTFVTIYRSGSVSEAAALLGIAQPTVSAHLHAVEAALGARLFERGPNGVTPTAKAIELAGEVAPHIDALDDVASLSGLAPAGRQALHLGGPAELIGTVLLPEWSRLRRAVEVPIWFRFGLAEDLLSALSAGELDVVLSAVRPHRAGIASLPLYDEEFVLVGSAGWVGIAAEGRWEDIPLFAYAGDLPIVRRYWRSVFGRRPHELRAAGVIPDLREIRALIHAGEGMSVLPTYLVRADLAAGALIELHRPDIRPLNTVYLASRAGEVDKAGPVQRAAAELTRILRAER